MTLLWHWNLYLGWLLLMLRAPVGGKNQEMGSEWVIGGTLIGVERAQLAAVWLFPRLRLTNQPVKPTNWKFIFGFGFFRNQENMQLARVVNFLRHQNLQLAKGNVSFNPFYFTSSPPINPAIMPPLRSSVGKWNFFGQYFWSIFLVNMVNMVNIFGQYFL